MIHIWHHNDPDGFAAAAVVLAHVEQALCLEISYGDAIPTYDLHKDDTLYIVDFSIPEDKFIEILDKGVEVIWLDHHKSAIEKISDETRSRTKGRRVIGKPCGAMLAWMWFNEKAEPPEVLKLINDWDTWSHLLEETKPFNAGLSIRDITPLSPIWKVLLTDDQKARALTREIIEQGRQILEIRIKENARMIQRYGFEVSFNGYKAIALNRKTSSMAVDSVADQYEITFFFVRDKEKWTISLYALSDGIDVAEIAKQYGGGGHPTAAGFECTDLHFPGDGTVNIIGAIDS
jgi:oligoribonuclease NrnB/cAMP/cGMP phosphodiesterase (DHH superfamily)